MDVDEDYRTLYVTNLHRNVCEELLYELFLQAGPVQKVTILNNSNKNCKYGFVTYHHECSIDYAIKLYKGTSLFKKELLIKKKGEKNNIDHNVSPSDRYSCENNQISEVSHHSADFGLSHLPQSLQTPDENSNKHRENGCKSNLIQSSLKGQWSNRSRPYNRENRRQNYSSRSFVSTYQHCTNLHPDPCYNKFYRKRGARF